MTTFTIADNDLDNIKDQVAVITGKLPCKWNSQITHSLGASAGIGLATLRRVIKHGGKVFASDLSPLPEPEASSVPFLKVDVTSWDDQLAMLKAAKQEYGTVDHVFANAGIGSSTSLLEEDVDDKGNLLPPKLNTIDVNLVGVMYTLKLAIHYLKKNPSGGSIVMAASAASFSRFPSADYSRYYQIALLFMLIARPSNDQARCSRSATRFPTTASSPTAHPHQCNRTILDRHSHLATPS